MSEQLFDLPNEAVAVTDPGLCGTRRLVAVQVVDVGRLQSEVLPLPASGGLVAVTGRGPVDSNESSKTTWEAAVDLLCMSHAWAPRSGRTGGWAEGLILKPDGMFARHQADRAFLLGCFRDDTRAGLPPVTVIAHIDRTSDQRLRFRLLEGHVFATGTTHQDRIADARTLWDQAPSNPTWSASAYLKKFLGGQPRSAGYVNRRGNHESDQVTLFTAELSKVPADRIAVDLLELTGLHDLVVNERRRRAEVAARSGEVVAARNTYQKEAATIEAELTAIEQREQALAATERAERARHAWMAAAAADAAARVAELAGRRQSLLQSPQAVQLRSKLAAVQADVDELADTAALQEAVGVATTHREQLRPEWEAACKAVDNARTARDRVAGAHDREALVQLAAQATGRSETVIAADLEAATYRRDRLREDLGAVRAKVKAATEHMTTLQEAGSYAAELVRQAGVDVAVLGDVVDITDAGRGLWDALLSAWQDALVVDLGDVSKAVRALADLPGTVLIAGHAADVPLPEGVADAPVHARPFLASLAAGANLDEQVITVAAVPHRIVGGYSAPQVGRDARMAAAQAAVAIETAERDRVEKDHGREAAEVTAIEGELAAARAASERRELADALGKARGRLAQAEADREALRPGWDAADNAVTVAEGRLSAQEHDLEVAREQLQAQATLLRKEVDEPAERLLRDAHQIDMGRRLQALAQLTDAPLPDALDPAAPDPDALTAITDAARTHLEQAEGEFGYQTTPSTKTWNRRSQRELDEALQLLDVTKTLQDGRDVVAAPSQVLPAVTAAYQKRLDLLADDDRLDGDADTSPASQVNASFHEVTGTLIDWLSPRVEQDAAAHQRLTRRLDDMQDELAAAEKAFEAQQAGAEAFTSTVQQLVESRLDKVAAAFAARVAASGDGERAELRIERIDPASEADSLRWRVVPAWSRAPGDPPTPYTKGNPNTAQEKIKAIQLILAAFATDGPPGRVLLLDELAAGLGSRNFADVLDTLAATARAEGLTILATIQDTHIDQVVDHVTSVLFFRYRSRHELLNDPTAVLAKGPDGALVELADAVTADRDEGWTPLVSDTEAWDGTSPLVPDDLASLFDDLDEPEARS